MRVIGTLLVLLGLVAVIYGGFTYTKREKVLDVGPIEASVDKRHTVPLPPIAGGIALLAGVFLLMRGDRRTA